MIRGDRIQDLLDEKVVSQGALARAIGVSPQAISKMVKGGTTDSPHIYKIARFLGTTPEFLTGESDVANAPGGNESRAAFGEFPVPAAEEIAAEHGLLPVRQIDLAFGMGATYLDVPVEEEMLFFPAQWLRQFTKAPASKLFFAQGVGDSMQPTLAPNDTLIIDCSIDRLTMADQIWALSYCGLGMIKRLRPTKDGGVRIMSDNPHIPEEIAFDGELQLIGRVVAVTRKI